MNSSINLHVLQIRQIDHRLPLTNRRTLFNHDRLTATRTFLGGINHFASLSRDEPTGLDLTLKQFQLLFLNTQGQLRRISRSLHLSHQSLALQTRPLSLSLRILSRLSQLLLFLRPSILFEHFKFAPVHAQQNLRLRHFQTSTLELVHVGITQPRLVPNSLVLLSIDR